MADDEHVAPRLTIRQRNVMPGSHGWRPRSSLGPTLSVHNVMALLASAMWENAWGKLPSCRPPDGVVLLGKETDVVAQAQQALIERGGLGVATHQGEAVDEPERAQEKRSLFSADAIIADSVVEPSTW